MTGGSSRFANVIEFLAHPVDINIALRMVFKRKTNIFSKAISSSILFPKFLRRNVEHRYYTRWVRLVPTTTLLAGMNK